LIFGVELRPLGASMWRSLVFTLMLFWNAAIRLALRSCRRQSLPLAKAAIYVAAIVDWLAGKSVNLSTLDRPRFEL
jgi:hypothetical protein